MDGIYLKFFVLESQKHRGTILYEWLLERAKELGIAGGSVFRAIAGFGRHKVIHEETFFELAGDLPLEVVFLVSESQAAQLIERVRQENPGLFYVKLRAEFGFIGPASQP